MSDNKQSNYRNSYDLDDTIQFTQEDLRKLRPPNKQPIDSDYFAEQEAESVVSEDKLESEKPFHYQSTEEQLHAQIESERRFKTQKRGQLIETIKNSLDAPYQNAYDEKITEQEEQRSREKKQVSFGKWFNHVKEKVRPLSQTKASVDEEMLEDAPVDEPIVESVEQEVTPLVDEIVSEIDDVQQHEIEVQFVDIELNEQETSDIDENETIDEVEKPLQSTISEAVEELSEQVSQVTQAYEEPILTDHVLEETLGYDNVIVEEVAEEQATFVKGTAWLTIGNLVSRILGALYVIPWAAWLGAEYPNANGLYSIGYRSYALFLAISTAGFPSAIAKQLAYYHSQKEYRVADKLFKVSAYIMIAMGVVSSAIFFLLAPFIAENSSTDNPEAAVIVIRSLAPALLILPLMSILRGYFQGFNDMVPTAISQILEQVARIVYLLVSTYAIMQILTGNVTTAVAHSTFAAFVGALVSLLYLIVVYLRRLPVIKQLIKTSAEQVNVDIMDSIKILVKDSIPFILLGSGIIIAQSIDQFTFKQILVSTTLLLESEISQLFGVMSLDVDKLIMIIISVAVGMSLSSIPLITSIYAQGDKKKTADLIEQISIVFLLIMLPASLGMASIANNMYQLFYANGHPQGPDLLVTASFLSIVLGAYTVISTVLQSMNYRRKAIKYLLIGLGIKVILQYPLVALFHAHGALVATLIAFLVTTILMLRKVHQLVRLDIERMLPDILIIVVSTVLVALSAMFWNMTFNLAFGPVGRLLTFIKILVVVLITAFSYFTILGLFGKLSLLIGNRLSELQEKLRMF